MVKKIIYAITIVGITYGAWRAYDEVRFGDRTAVFFRTVFADEEEAGRSRGRGAFERRAPPANDTERSEWETDDRRTRRPSEGSEARPDTAFSEPGEETTPAQVDIGQTRPPRPQAAEDAGVEGFRRRGEDGHRMARPSRGFGGQGRGRRGGSTVSLDEVGYYSIILAFATMLTFLVDSTLKRVKRSRQDRAKEFRATA